MIIDCINEMYYVDSYEGMLRAYKSLMGYVYPDDDEYGCYIPYIEDAFSTKDNDKIRKALRHYIITERYNRRFFKIIRDFDWVNGKLTNPNLIQYYIQNTIKDNEKWGKYFERERKQKALESGLED